MSYVVRLLLQTHCPLVFICFEHVNQVIVNLKESEMVGFVYERFFEDHSSSNNCNFWDCRLLISEGETVFIIVVSKLRMSELRGNA